MEKSHTDKNQIQRTVHIIPLGFEVERALAPFSNRHIDKVILVVNNQELPGGETEAFPDKQKGYTEKVMAKLKKKEIEVEVVEARSFDMGELIRVLSSLIRKEKDAGNSVSINTSSSGRFASIAAAFAGMAHDIDVYYVVADRYSKSEEEIVSHGVSRCICSDPVVRVIPNFQLMLPEKEEALILELLYVTKMNNLLNPDKHWVSLKSIGKMLHDAYPDKYPWRPVENPKDLKYKKTSDNSGEAGLEGADEYQTYRDLQASFSNKFQVIARKFHERNYMRRNESDRKSTSYAIEQSGEYALYLYGISGLIRYGKEGAYYCLPESEGEKEAGKKE